MSLVLFQWADKFRKLLGRLSIRQVAVVGGGRHSVLPVLTAARWTFDFAEGIGGLQLLKEFLENNILRLVTPPEG